MSISTSPAANWVSSAFRIRRMATHGDAWGVTQVPIAVIEGGKHGDEYEGPITIGELARDLDPQMIQGRLILMPANNVHAVLAAMRTSPVDGLNFNRVWPGDAMGTITQQIAAYVTQRIFPMAHAFLDLHSGGSSLDILPSAIIEPASDPELHRRNVAAVQAFDAPYNAVISNMGDKRTATATASTNPLERLNGLLPVSWTPR